MNSASIQKRNPSLDLVRITAAFFVICTHSYFQNGFYSLPVNGLYFYVLSIFRNLFLSCVPLFLILTGYLMNKKALSRHYYKGILKTLCVYFLASCATAIFRIYILREELTFKQLFLGLTGFNLAPYAWYIEMYIGLFLLIPFLNLSYHSLQTKKQKQCLLFSCLLLTAIPPVFNMFNFEQSHTFLQLITIDGSDTLLPAFWLQIYPFTYYFLGCYLCEFKIRIKKSHLVLLLFLHLLITGTFVYIRNFNSKFAWSPYLEWESVIPLISALLIFLIISNIDTSNWNIQIIKLIKYCSDLCLGAYLVSWIFDVLFYSNAISNISNPVIFKIHLPGLIISIFMCSLLLSAAINFLTRYILDFVNRKKAVSSKT